MYSITVVTDFSVTGNCPVEPSGSAGQYFEYRDISLDNILYHGY